MAGYFVDSSALVKCYVNETGSVWLSGLVAPAAGNDIYIARITTVEVLAALACRARGETIAAADASAACLLFRNDVPHDYEIVDSTGTAFYNRAHSVFTQHMCRRPSGWGVLLPLGRRKRLYGIATAQNSAPGVVATGIF